MSSGMTTLTLPPTLEKIWEDETRSITDSTDSIRHNTILTTVINALQAVIAFPVPH